MDIALRNTAPPAQRPLHDSSASLRRRHRPAQQPKTLHPTPDTHAGFRPLSPIRHLHIIIPYCLLSLLVFISVPASRTTLSGLSFRGNAMAWCANSRGGSGGLWFGRADNDMNAMAYAFIKHRDGRLMFRDMPSSESIRVFSIDFRNSIRLSQPCFSAHVQSFLGGNYPPKQTIAKGRTILVLEDFRSVIHHLYEKWLEIRTYVC